MGRVLVTGSGGFVGRVLIDALRSKGREVFGVDHKPVTDGVDGVEYLTRDLQDRKAVDDILADVEPQNIVHLAAQSSAGRSFAEPGETIKNNVVPTLNILEYLRTSGKQARFLAVGSADCYGDVGASELPLTESQPLNPANPYAVSKAFQERLCMQYSILYDIDVVSTRSFNHSGAGQTSTFVLSSFAKQVAEIAAGRKEPRVMVGNVELRRDFTDVRDVVQAYMLLLDKGESGEVYNVCSGTVYSLREMLETLATLAGVKIQIETDRDRLRPTDMKELRGDNTKLRRATGWSPKYSTKDMLQSLLDYWMQPLADSTN